MGLELTKHLVYFFSELLPVFFIAPPKLSMSVPSPRKVLHLVRIEPQNAISTITVSFFIKIISLEKRENVMHYPQCNQISVQISFE